MAKLSDTSCAILSAERARLINLLPDIDPRSELYSRVLDNLRTVDYTLFEHEREKEHETPKPEKTPDPEANPVEEEPAPPKKAKKPAKKEAPSEEPKAPAMSEDEVKAILSDLSREGKINLPQLVAKYIPEGADLVFSSVPKDAYEALVKEAKSYAG